MRSEVAVAVAPDSQSPPGVNKVIEKILVEQLVAPRSFEELVERVLLGLTGVYAVALDAFLADPSQDRPTGQLGSSRPAEWRVLKDLLPTQPENHCR